MASGVLTFGLPSSPTITPPAPLTASAKLTVRPSYLLYWPAKQSNLNCSRPALILSQPASSRRMLWAAQAVLVQQVLAVVQQTTVGGARVARTAC